MLKTIWSIPTSKERARAFILIGMMAVSAALEIVGIGLIVPVVGLLAKPELAEKNPLIRTIRQFLNAPEDQFLVRLCLAIAVLFILKTLFMILQIHLQTQFVYKMGARLGCQLYDKYIHAPYAFHLDQNAGYLMGALNLSSSIPASILMPMLMLISEVLVITFVCIALLVVSPVTTMVLAALGITLVGALFLSTHHWNMTLGRNFQQHALQTNKYALQGLKAIKESKIRNAEDFFTAEYGRHRCLRSNVEAMRNFLGNVPRFVIEALVVCMGMALVIVLSKRSQESSSVLMTTSLLAVSMVRLLPSFTRIQYSLTMIKQNQAVLERYQQEAVDLAPEDKTAKNADLPFNKEIKLDCLTFQYKKDGPAVLDNISLSVAKNESVAFVGPTGCGKTTVIDILLGLLKPTSGRVLVDGVDIEKNLPAWQKRVGYVPQFIFLLDDTIESNVAFGVPNEDIDPKRVRECLATAQILKYIDGLPSGAMTIVGDNGIKLSGGQRQRIGIARALYHNPEILVLDEATSALDNDTEKAFVDAIRNLHGTMTILMVAHRLTTVKNCDRIINLGDSNKPLPGISELSARTGGPQ